MQSLLLVAVGGALGSLVRFKLGAAILHHSAAAQFPYGTFVVNVLGCLAAGLLAGLDESVLEDEPPVLELLGALGVVAVSEELLPVDCAHAALASSAAAAAAARDFIVMELSLCE